MPRSSFSRNPLLRVSRPVSACSRCRAAKVKCDGKLPACTACEKAGRESECSAANDQFARGKERSYVAALELRIEKLERRLQYAKSRKASVANHEPDASVMAAPDRKDSLALIKAAIHRKAARNRENSDVNSLVSDFGYMSVNANSRDFEPTAGNMTFARLVLTTTSNNALPASTEPDLPPRQTANAVVQYFMANIYCLFPCFSETALLTILDDVYQQDQRTIKDSDYWLMYMVMAIGYTAQSQRLQDANYENGVEYVAKALKYADGALAPGNYTQIQSLLLLTIYSMLDPAHFDSWHLIGYTARAVVDLGCHQDPPTSSSSDRTALDMRRRIFYSTYAIDRAISMVHARTFSFTDDSVNVAFPNSIVRRKSSGAGPISGPQSADPALLLFQLRRAQSFWYQELYQSDPTPLADPTSFLWQMCLDMREWSESLPETLPPGLRRMFEQELRYSYVYCIAPSVRAPQITDYTRTLIFEYSLEYLNIMYEIAHNGLNSAFYTYHDALKVYFMGNQLLAVLRDAEDMLLAPAGSRAVQPPAQRPGCPPPPPIPRRTVQTGRNDDPLERSIWCLERVPQTLTKYAERWDDSTMLLNSFQQLSAEPLQRLADRRSRASNSSASSQQQHQHQHQHQHQYQYQNQNQNGAGGQPSPGQQQQQQHWVGVNVAQMMHGGPPQ